MQSENNIPDEQSPQADGAGGDQISVGDITESKAIAIGRNIQQTVYEGYTAEEVALIVAETRRAEDAAAPPIEIPAPPEPTRPPEISGFVGRDEELSYFADVLARSHIAVIAGMAGVGKTALAATLISEVVREPSRVFWHSFHEGEGMDAIIWSLAGFLAWHGKEDLWKLLQSARLTGGQPPPPETLFDYVLQLVRHGNYLLCFDDFHHVDDDPTLNQLVERLREALRAGELSLILTSRRVPEFVTIAQFEAVGGLSDGDTRRLLQSKGVGLTPEQMDKLYTATGGNAEFLILAIDALQNARDPEDLLERLAESDDIERYLLNEVDDVLTGQERTVMNALAALLGYAATRDAVEAVVDRGNVFRTLRGLTERHLLVVQETDAGRAYRQHDLVREFYYEMSSRRERKKLHGRAGEYYRDDEEDLLLAGIHYERAGEVEEAARLATEDVWGVINRGQIRVLGRLLGKLSEKRLSAYESVRLHLSLGQIQAVSGERATAHQQYVKALQLLDQHPNVESQQQLRIELYLNTAQLLEDEAPEDAVRWLEQGLELPGLTAKNSAAFYIHLGTILITLGGYERALQDTLHGLDQLSDEPSQLRCIALRNLGAIYGYHHGDVSAGQAYSLQALKISKTLTDHFNTVAILSNVGTFHLYEGDKKKAAEYYQRALDLADSIGSKQYSTAIETNLGMAYFELGEINSAHEHLTRSIRVAQIIEDKNTQIYALTKLAEVYIWECRWVKSQEMLTSAEKLASDIGNPSSLPFILSNRAKIFLHLNRIEESIQLSAKALSLAQELGDPYTEGVCLRIQASGLAATMNFEDAQNLLRQSLHLLIDQDPYEAAVTQLEIAQLLLTQRKIEGAKENLAEAENIFQSIGAKHQLDYIRQIVSPQL